MNPLFSIVTVSYNCAETIEKTIKSVLSQSYSNIEYIIIDGASKDGTVDIIRKYDTAISYWISEPDGGIYEAMNKGIEVATGELIGFINGDDCYIDGAIEAIAQKYIETNGDVIYGDMIYIGANGKETYVKSNDDISDLYYQMSIPHPSTFCKTVLLKKDKFDVGYKIASDYKFLLRLYNDNMSFVHVDKAISRFYCGGVSTSKLYKTSQETYDISKSVIKGNYYLEEKYLDKIEKQYKDIIVNLIFDRTVKYGYLYTWLKQQIDHGEGVYIFGTGKIGIRIYEMLLKAGITINGFLDNNEKKQGRKISGIEILSPSVLKSVDKARIVVSTTKYEREMLRQLEDINREKTLTVVTYNQLKTHACKAYLSDAKLFGGVL